MDSTKAVTKDEPSNTLAYHVERRSENKRNYIYDYGKSFTCDHSSLTVVARGGIVYRCKDCNYSFHITGAYQQPLHHEVIQGAFTMLGFAKEFGTDSLQEVLRRPIGQSDGKPHKPVLPDGMSFMDALAEMEGIDVTSLDGGKAQLAALVEAKWSVPEQNAISNNEPLSLTESNDDTDQETTPA
jgi:hypothetical protein